MCPCFDVPILLTIVSNWAAAAATTLSLFAGTHGGVMPDVDDGGCDEGIWYGDGMNSGAD